MSTSSFVTVGGGVRCELLRRGLPRQLIHGPVAQVARSGHRNRVNLHAGRGYQSPRVLRVKQGPITRHAGQGDEFSQFHTCRCRKSRGLPRDKQDLQISASCRMIAAGLSAAPVPEGGEGQSAGLKVRRHLTAMSQHVRNVIDAVTEAWDDADQWPCGGGRPGAEVQDLGSTIRRVAG